MPDINFNGDVAIVTGAGGGMGREIALLLAARGARVLVNDYGGDGFGKAGSADRAEAVAREIRDAGGEAVAEASAVGSAETAHRIVATAIAAFGRVDILINNAGIIAPGAIDAVTDEVLTRAIEINLLGQYRLIQAVWPQMRTQGGGRILNVSSNSSLGYANFSTYGASKAGVLGLTANAAIDGKPHGIIVNSLLPVASTRLINSGTEAAASSNPDFYAWLDLHFPPRLIAPVALALLSPGLAVSGMHFTSGGGRVARLMHVVTEGIHAVTPTPESVLAGLPAVIDGSETVPVGSGMEELLVYRRSIPA